MTKQVALEAQVRDGLGKEKTKKLRGQGLVPAEFYGKGVENLHLVVNHKVFYKAVKDSEAKLNSLFNLTIKGKGKDMQELVMLRDYQRHPISDLFEHLDFLRIDPKHPISVKVPVKLVGDCPALKAGLTMAQALHELPVKVLPLEIPLFIEIDMTKLEKAHDAIRVSDINLPGVTIELPQGQEIIHAEVPRELKVETEAPAATTAEVPATAQKAPEAEAAPAKDAKAAPAAKPEAKK
jgi:large subunit ribosomal protein L25